MIPPVVGPQASPGERHLHDLLRKDAAAKDWIVLHSLDIARHRQQISGEADFVILAPGLGALVLEVKGHRSVRRGNDGMWRLGSDPPTHRSPFRQAGDNMHSLRERLAAIRPAFKPLLFASAVCFPFARFSLSEPVEWHPWQVIDRQNLECAHISECLTDVLKHAAAAASGAKTARWFDASRSLPSPSDCELAARLLRPEFEFFESPASRRKLRIDELKRFTEEQFAVLDAVAGNDRLVLEGAAGTGKTLLAIEAARRAADGNASVLVCCYNRLLGKWLAAELSSLDLTAGTIHRYMLDVAGLQPPADADGQFWDQTLPDAAIEVLLSGSPRGQVFDVLIVDEAQDILSSAYLDVLDLSLRGGLDQGCWIMFGDFERQSLYGRSKSAHPTSALEERSLAPARFSLTANCRNTPRIAALVTAIGELDSGWARILRPDNGIEPKWYFHRTSRQQAGHLDSLLDLIESEGYARSEITVLSPRAKGSTAQAVTGKWANHIRPAAVAGKGKIRQATVHAFKGLESPVVIVTDIDRVDRPSDEALLYTAMTRATERLAVLAHEDSQPELSRRVMGGPA